MKDKIYGLPEKTEDWLPQYVAVLKANIEAFDSSIKRHGDNNPESKHDFPLIKRGFIVSLEFITKHQELMLRNGGRLLAIKRKEEGNDYPEYMAGCRICGEAGKISPLEETDDPDVVRCSVCGEMRIKDLYKPLTEENYE